MEFRVVAEKPNKPTRKLMFRAPFCRPPLIKFPKNPITLELIGSCFDINSVIAMIKRHKNKTSEKVST